MRKTSLLSEASLKKKNNAYKQPLGHTSAVAALWLAGSSLPMGGEMEMRCIRLKHLVMICSKLSWHLTEVFETRRTQQILIHLPEE